MANRANRAAMSPAKRAKQFAPFAAVKGLDEALAEKAKLRVPRRAIADDLAAEINRSLTAMERGQIISVVYYDEFEQEYVRLTGKVTKIDETRKLLYVDEKAVDIYDIVEIGGM